MKKQRFILPRNVKNIISMLNGAGFRADIVGGSVRDILLGKEPFDYDITTSASPEEMKTVFSGFRTLETGIKHGTLTLIIEKQPYEITTYRLDGDYTDNRHPDKVSFTEDITEDLSRRDFTVNAMCYNEKDGFTDIFGGCSDIENKIIRAVGEPEKRFSEDALRIMRALRFASTLNFSIEENTAAAIRKTAHLLLNVSSERIFAEWKKLIAGDGAYRILTEFFDVIKSVVPNIDIFGLPCEECFMLASPELRELSLFKSKENYAAAMKKLKCDNKRRIFGCSVLESSESNLKTRKEIAASLVMFGEGVTRFAIELKLLCGSLSQDTLDCYDGLIKDGICYTLHDLKIDGNQLSELGLSGQDIGTELLRLLLLVANGEVANVYEELVREVTKE